MKPKKSMRSFRCPDTLWSLVKAASKNVEMSTNEWVLTALRQALKQGVQGEGGVDVEAESSLATAHALETHLAGVKKLEETILSTNEFWKNETAKLKEELQKLEKSKLIGRKVVSRTPPNI